MSLEQALADNTATMKTLITVLQSAGHAVAPVAAPAVPKAAKADKTPAPVADAPAAKQPVAMGDPEGTQYFVIEAHNTVFAVKPGDVQPNVAGAVQVHVDTYLAKKDEFAKKIKAAGAASSEAAAPAQAPAATPAVPAPSAAAPAATVSAAEPGFPDVVAKIKELHGLQGNEGVLKVLGQYKASNVPGLQGKAGNAELIAAAQHFIDEAKSAAALGL